MSRVLTESQIAKYRQAGVLFPLTALEGGAVDRFRAQFMHYLEILGGRLVTRKLQQLHLYHNWARELASLPTVLDAVEDVLGPDILIHSSTFFCKYPADGSFVSWHQDGYYLGLSQRDYTSAWIALTDSLPDNGCMRVVPGSHIHGLQPHNESAVSPKNLLASGMNVEREVQEKDAADVMLRPGEFSLHDVAIVHGSNPNCSDRMRIGMAVRFVHPRVSQQLDHHPVILVRGADRYGNYSLLKNPPTADDEESLQRGVRCQAELLDWVIAARASATPIAIPDTAGLSFVKKDAK